MFETFFEASFVHSNIDLYLLLGFILTVFFSSFVLRKIYCRLFGAKSEINFWVIIFAFLAFLGTKAFSLSKYIAQFEGIKAGDFLKVEGKIKNLKFHEGRARGESFTVDGVVFKYNEYGTPKYYFANRGPEFISLKNDIIVRVFFINSGGENFIFKLEVAMNSD